MPGIHPWVTCLVYTRGYGRDTPCTPVSTVGIPHVHPLMGGIYSLYTPVDGRHIQPLYTRRLGRWSYYTRRLGRWPYYTRGLGGMGPVHPRGLGGMGPVHPGMYTRVYTPGILHPPGYTHHPPLLAGSLHVTDLLVRCGETRPWALRGK